MITVIIVASLLLIPTIPLVLYFIGLLLPSEHVVSRTQKYNTTPYILWTILTSVRDYPAWRSNIEEVNIRSDDFENDLNKYEDDNRVTFIEYSKKKRRTVIIHIEQEHEKKLLRVLEERPYIAPGEGTTTSNATFHGTWSFTIEPIDEESVELTIKEQGVIKKPMVRTLHRFFFGYHRGIDRFMKDLANEIELGFLEQEEEEQEPTTTTATIIEEDEEEDEEEDNDYEAGPDDSIIQPSQPLMTESKILDKEWDMI
jgi:hypothetical protein